MVQVGREERLSRDTADGTEDVGGSIVGDEEGHRECESAGGDPIEKDESEKILRALRNYSVKFNVIIMQITHLLVMLAPFLNIPIPKSLLVSDSFNISNTCVGSYYEFHYLSTHQFNKLVSGCNKCTQVSTTRAKSSKPVFKPKANELRDDKSFRLRFHQDLHLPGFNHMGITLFYILDVWATVSVEDDEQFLKLVLKTVCDSNKQLGKYHRMRENGGVMPRQEMPHKWRRDGIRFQDRY